jgi:hypothetical protein
MFKEYSEPALGCSPNIMKETKLKKTVPLNFSMSNIHLTTYHCDIVVLLNHLTNGSEFFFQVVAPHISNPTFFITRDVGMTTVRATAAYTRK